METIDYSRPKEWHVRWYDEDNELHELDLRSRDLALRIADVKMGIVSTRSV